MDRIQVVLRMRSVRSLLGRTGHPDTPCQEGLQRLYSRWHIGSVMDYTADMLRADLVRSASDSFSFSDYDWFLERFLPGYNNSMCEVDMYRSPFYGNEWATVCRYYDISVEE